MATVTSVFQETEYYVWIELRPGEETDSFVEEFKTNPETAWEQLYKDLVENNIGAWPQICNGDYIEGQQDLVGERIQIIPPSTILDVELYEAIPDISPDTTGFDIDVETVDVTHEGLNLLRVMIDGKISHSHIKDTISRAIDHYQSGSVNIFLLNFYSDHPITSKLYNWFHPYIKWCDTGDIHEHCGCMYKDLLTACPGSCPEWENSAQLYGCGINFHTFQKCGPLSVICHTARNDDKLLESYPNTRTTGRIQYIWDKGLDSDGIPIFERDRSIGMLKFGLFNHHEKRTKCNEFRLPINRTFECEPHPSIILNYRNKQKKPTKSAQKLATEYF